MIRLKLKTLKFSCNPLKFLKSLRWFAFYHRFGECHTIQFFEDGNYRTPFVVFGSFYDRKGTFNLKVSNDINAGVKIFVVLWFEVLNGVGVWLLLKKVVTGWG